MSELKHTPLHAFHIRHGARMVPFGGWDMPVQYSSIVEEHKTVRKALGLFDVSHMGEAHVSGPDAKVFLNYVMTNDLSSVKLGKAQYSLMCYPDGGVVDDLLIYALGENDYLLCLNAANTEKDIVWLQQHVSPFDCKVEDVSAMYAQLALQGPRSVEVLNTLVDADSIKHFMFKEMKVHEMDLLISRTGYTGEDGFELYCHPDDAEPLAEALLKAGEFCGIRLAGLGARDSLRLEAGYPLYGHEISEKISPIQAGLLFAVKFSKADFIGKRALEAQKNTGDFPRIVFFKLEDRRIARQGSKIYYQNEEVGEVLSGTQSPILSLPIGSGIINVPFDKDLEVDIRGNRIPLLLIRPPFV